MAAVSDYSLASFIAGSFTLLSIATTYYFKNKRSMKRISVEDFIEGFMKRQQEEIANKDTQLLQRDQTIKDLETAVKKLTQKTYKYENLVKELRNLIKDLRKEVSQERSHNESMKEELSNLKDTYEKIYSKKLYDTLKGDK